MSNIFSFVVYGLIFTEIAVGFSLSIAGLAGGRIGLTRGGNLMEGIEVAANRIEALRREIGLLQRAIKKSNVKESKKGRQETQLALLHQKRARIKKQAEKELLMRYLNVL